MQVITYRMDKQQGSTVQDRNYIQYPVTNHNEKKIKKKVYMYILSHLLYVAEIKPTL